MSYILKGYSGKSSSIPNDNKGNRTEVNVYDAKASEHPTKNPSAGTEKPKEEEPKNSLMMRFLTLSFSL